MSSFRCLVVSLPILVLFLGSLPSNANAITFRHPTNFSVGIEGIVFCKSCKLQGYDKSMDASPVPGATASLLCIVGKRGATVKATTDSNGYFLIQTSTLTSFTARKCRVFVKPSPLRYCNVAVYPGRGGAALKFERVLKLPNNELQILYTAGAFVFGPRNVTMCPQM
ncbi:non-classical arabinogalactan protein 31-like [Typha angustifolia]|uniref:non-classical arabinogalactan protein 31-like n=1 Tax=Typha angustifolia TaxID=59011 RepID=UPI003C309CEA